MMLRGNPSLRRSCFVRAFAKESVSKVRPGRVIDIDGRLNTILSTKHVMQGRGGAHINFETRDVLSSVKSLLRYSSDETVETVTLESEPQTLLYRDGNKLVLMHEETFEQIEVDDDIVDPKIRRFLSDGLTLTVQMHEGQAVSVEVPLKVSCEIAEELGTIGGQGPASKLVRLDNGVELRCPAFVTAGDTIIVKTTDASYVGRA
mmetsp:Transcript_11974/g.23759  ORF Transcript_11974/g.23759 Transcript_11974/m.23759 type:complete len:204 (+) Transcript_11974:101-712(+)